MLQGENLPLGVSEQEIYDRSRCRLEPGDVLLFYSDGLTETRNGRGAVRHRASRRVRSGQHGRLEPRDLIDQIRSGGGRVLELGNVRRRPDLRRRAD